jgi:hypothetical protein
MAGRQDELVMHPVPNAGYAAQTAAETNARGFHRVVGNGCLIRIANNAFENSFNIFIIENLSDLVSQRIFAREIERASRCAFLFSNFLSAS